MKRSNFYNFSPAMLAIVVTGLMFYVSYLTGLHPDYADVSYYHLMALFDYSHVTEPYRSRILGPTLAGILHNLTSLNADGSIFFVSFFFFFLSMLVWGYWCKSQGVPLLVLCLGLFMPYLAGLSKYAFVPDSVAVFFGVTSLILLERQNRSGSILAMLGILARKTLFVAYIFYGLLGLIRRNYRLPLVLVVSCVFAVIVLKFVTPVGESNIHDMNAFSYYVLKIPANLITNIFGINLYTNTIQWCSTPVRVFDVGLIPGLGHIKRIGYCEPEPYKIMVTFALYVFSFGAWPWLAYRFVKRHWRSAVSNAPIAFLVFFLIAPGFGRSVVRLFLYAEIFLMPIIPRLFYFAHEEGYAKRFIAVSGAIQGIGCSVILAGYLQPE